MMAQTPQSAATPSTARCQLYNSTPIDPTRKRKFLADEKVIVDGIDQCRINIQARQLSDSHSTPDKSVKYDPNFESPMRETQRILYGGRRPNVTPHKLLSTPQKTVIGAISTTQDLLKELIRTDVVMSKIFGFLSDGELFRLACAHNDFEMAIQRDGKATKRYAIYCLYYQRNKENYAITPPPSPEKSDTVPDSPKKRRLEDFHRVGSKLNSSQTMQKCPSCTSPCIIENDLGQCQNFLCGYIYCRLCGSYTYNGPEEFYDACKNSALNFSEKMSSSSSTSSRTRLGNLSNLPDGNTSNSLRSESGYYSADTSGVERRKPKITIERKVLGQHNNVGPKRMKRSRTDSVRNFAEVIALNRRSDERTSPPPKNYSIGSMQSKKNLKRLKF